MQASRGRAGQARRIENGDQARPTDYAERAVPLRRKGATDPRAIEISLAGRTNRIRPIRLDEMVIDEPTIGEIPERVRSAGMGSPVQSAA